MVAAGLLAGRHVRPGRRRRGARPAAGAPGAVVHALVRRRRYGALGRARPARGVRPAPAGPARAGAWCARCCSCRSCCRPWWSAWPSASCSARAGRSASSVSTRPRSAVVAGLVFFNVAVVIRAVGAAWESLDPRPAQAAATLGATPVAGAAHGDPARPAAGDRVRGQRGLPLLRDRVRDRAHPRRCPQRHRRDRDLPADHDRVRPPGRGRAVGAAAAWSWSGCC